MLPRQSRQTPHSPYKTSSCRQISLLLLFFPRLDILVDGYTSLYRNITSSISTNPRKSLYTTIQNYLVSWYHLVVLSNSAARTRHPNANHADHELEENGRNWRKGRNWKGKEERPPDETRMPNVYRRHTTQHDTTNLSLWKWLQDSEGSYGCL